MLHEFCPKTPELLCEPREDNLEHIHNLRMKKNKRINSGTTTKLERTKRNDPDARLSACSLTMTKTLTSTPDTVPKLVKHSAAETDET